MPRKIIILDDGTRLYDEWVEDQFDYDEEEYDDYSEDDNEFEQLYYGWLLIDDIDQ